MLDEVGDSEELLSGLNRCWASIAHPVPPAAGGYVLVDSAPMLAAVATGAISAVLVLPRGDQALLTPVHSRSGLPATPFERH